MYDLIFYKDEDIFFIIDDLNDEDDDEGVKDKKESDTYAGRYFCCIFLFKKTNRY